MQYPKHFVGQALWLYCRFNLSHRDIEDLLAERGITVSREAIRVELLIQNAQVVWWCLLRRVSRHGNN